jgi:hypothetical protein
MGVSNPLIDSSWDLDGACGLDALGNGYLVSPDPTSLDAEAVVSPPEPPAMGSIRSRADAAWEELHALGVSVDASFDEVLAALTCRFPSGIRPEQVNPHTGFPFTRATESWAAG